MRNALLSALVAAAGVVAVVASADLPTGSEPPEPLVGRVEPSSGPPGTRVTIHGQNFLPGSTVMFGGVDAVVEEITPMRIVAVVPPHKPGRVSVQVSLPNNRGSGVRGWAFTYEAPAGSAGGEAPPWTS